MSKQRHKNKLLLWALVACMGLLLVACDQASAPPENALLGELRSMPVPDLSAMEPSVAAQLTQLRNEVLVKAKTAVTPAGLVPHLMVLGESYHAHSLLQAATWCYQWVEQKLPGKTDAGYLIALLQGESGRFEQAIKGIQSWILDHPDDLNAKFRLAQWQDQSGQGSTALGTLDEIILLDPEHAPARALRGSIRLAGNDPEGALEDLELATRLAPKAGQAQYLAAQALMRLGRRDEAAVYLARRGGGMPALHDPLAARISQRASGSRSYLSNGSKAMREGRFDIAIALFEKARQADPDNPTAWLNLGAALAQTGQYSEASKVLEAALALDMPKANRSRTHFNLGLMAMSAGDADKAIEHLQSALELDPQNTQAKNVLASLQSG